MTKERKKLVGMQSIMPRMFGSFAWLIAALTLLGATTTRPASARDYAALSVVKPVVACEALRRAQISGTVGAAVTMQSANVVTTGKGSFCKVVGNIAPTIGFEVELPIEHWTQRLLQGGCGGFCGEINIRVTNASTCLPALNGEFAVASSDMGHKAHIGGDDEGLFAADPQKRIDFAYRGNHLTALATKALVRAFYGQAPRYSYFMGCSDGGREALVEAQRFPEDFDGISAGDPAALFTVQNSFYHAWNVRANQRSDGTNILMPAKRQLVHDAAVAQCDTLSGVRDGLLQDPRTCRFSPGSIQCRAGAADTAKCLTEEEATVVEKLYEGASDRDSQIFTFGAERGSEAEWGLPSTATGSSGSVGMAQHAIGYLLLPIANPALGELSRFAFTQANFTRMNALAPLYNAANTNLKPFASRGGKLILWHGWSDASITPGVSIAYYEGVQRFMGAAATNQVLRLFLLPGVSHCGGGDGYNEIDLLSPLMAWTELGRAPDKIVTGKPAGRRFGPPGAPGPIASPLEKLVATRPVYAYPAIPRYVGKGDPNDAASYASVRSPVQTPRTLREASLGLIGPDNQKSYSVEQGRLVPNVR